MAFTEIIPETVVHRCLKFLVFAAVIYGALWAVHFQQFFRDDAEGIATLLQVIGTLYSVLYAFATYVIWGQFTAVESEILQESGALKDILLFGSRLKEATREPMVRAVKAYARAVTETEWVALSRGKDTENTDKLFTAIITAVADAKPEDDSERIVYERLLEIANHASAHRDQRLALSVKRMPRTLLVFVMLTAFTILFLLFFYPFHNAPLGVISIVITASLLFFAHFVVTDLDNPFEGTWNVKNNAFAELITKFR